MWWLSFLAIISIVLLIQGNLELDNFIKGALSLIFICAPLTAGLFYYYVNVYQPKQLDQFLQKLDFITSLGFERDGNSYTITHNDFYISLFYEAPLSGGSSILFLTTIIGEPKQLGKLQEHLKNTEIDITDNSTILVHRLPLIMNKVPTKTVISNKLDFITESSKKFQIQSGIEKD